jgi:hypothetical protein
MSGKSNHEDPNEWGLFVQTERPLHEPARSFIDIYEGHGRDVANQGRAILRWWRNRGGQSLWEGRGHQRAARRAIVEIISDYCRRDGEMR